MRVDVDNTKSLLDVVRLKGTLYCTIRLTTNFGQATVLKQRINEEYANQRIPAGQSLSIGMTLAVQDSTRSVHSATHLRGNSIVCVYTVEVRAEMAGCFKCYGQVPEITRVVIIYPKQLPVEEVVQAPVGWRPTDVPEYKLSPD